ncbi:hypothetical protein GS682_19220 [Nostoc sp. B(2019)]|nr:hypothetical protein [Nostoc sp. B(2019)]
MTLLRTLVPLYETLLCSLLPRRGTLSLTAVRSRTRSKRSYAVGAASRREGFTLRYRPTALWASYGGRLTPLAPLEETPSHDCVSRHLLPLGRPQDRSGSPWEKTTVAPLDL